MSDELRKPVGVVFPLACSGRGIVDARLEVVAECDYSSEAAQIVHRVNCHDKLVEAVKSASVVLSGNALNKEQLIRALEKCRAALELAKGGGHD